MYKAALKSSLYDFTSARDFYREATTAAGIGMHDALVMKYIELQALVLTPIAPHWSEHVWLEILKKVCLCCLFSFCHPPSRAVPRNEATGSR
jgi:leucyl-tRNA synthetase